MATSTGKSQCVTCKKEKAGYKCEGCSQYFCINHLPEHQQELWKELDEIEDHRNLFQQKITETKANPQKQLLIQQVNQWEKDSIEKIQQTAEEARRVLMKHTNTYIGEIEMKLEQLTNQLKYTRQENDFNEIILNQLEQKFQELENELNTPSSVSIQQDGSSSFINRLTVIKPCSKWSFHILIMSGQMCLFSLI